MIYRIIVILSLLILIVPCCEYIDPLVSISKDDLIKNYDLSNDWTRDNGIMLDATAEAAPSGESGAYHLYFNNLVSYDTFEASAGPNDFDTWQESASAPDFTEVTTDASMYGSKYLHIELNRDTNAQYFYHLFSSDTTRDYVFRFNYIHVDGGDIQLSFGQAGVDETRTGITAGTGLNKALFDITTFASAATNFEVRFGYANNTPDPQSYEIYLDNIALFIKSGTSINLQTSIEYDGVHKLTIYAKENTSSVLTLMLGNEYQTFSLSNSWVKYELDAYLLESNGKVTIKIIPTNYSDIDKFPGGIYITKPHLNLVN